MTGPDRFDDTSADYEQFEKEQLAQDRDVDGDDTAGRTGGDGGLHRDVATAAPGVALIAHFTGFVLGLVAGRLRLLAAHSGSRRNPLT